MCSWAKNMPVLAGRFAFHLIVELQKNLIVQTKPTFFFAFLRVKKHRRGKNFCVYLRKIRDDFFGRDEKHAAHEDGTG